jgi:DNA mismatch repair protein MutS
VSEKESLILPKEFQALSPMYQHYFSIQYKNPEAIICYQVGDFYEIWSKNELGHVEKAHRILDIKKTKRNKADPKSPAMCGFNVSVSDFYFKKLVNNGNTVIVVSQKINGRKSDQNKGVPRFIEKILTPGTIVENLSEEKNNYYACLIKQDNIIGISLVDLSTGAVKVTEILEQDLNDYLNNFNPTEILVFGDLKINTKKFKFVHNKSKMNIKNLADSGRVLSHLYNLDTPTSNPEYHISTLGLDKWRFATLSLANLVDHLSSTEYSTSLLRKLSEPEIYNKTNHLLIPMNGLKSLEVFENQSGSEEDSLAYCLDKCYTAMGRRKLREWLREPLINIDEIEARYTVVEKYIKNKTDYKELKKVYDIARMSRRIFLGTIDPMDISNLYSSLLSIHSILKTENNETHKTVDTIIKYLSENIDFEELSLETENSYLYFKGDFAKSLLERKEKWEKSHEDMNSLKKEYDIKAQEFLIDNKKKFKEIIQTKESYKLKGPKSFNCKTKKLNQIVSFKILASEVEVIDDEWINVSNKAFLDMQRYKMKAFKEWRLFLSKVSELFGKDLHSISEEISKVDVLNNFARISQERDYNKPTLIESEHSFLNIKNLRHPVVENNFRLEEEYTPNDIFFDKDKDIMCIYGANSSGKSTVLKALALNIIMAQIGCFISSDKGSELTTFQNILTRMTTYDSLSEGLSTFTMEMKELNESLRYTEQRSLFLFDEIGRGTSAEDGEALAFSTLDYLSKEDNKGLTFFATHYHKMGPKLIQYDNICIKNMDTYIDNIGKLSFTRKLVDGVGEGSYGIDVALSCGLPEDLIRVAKNYNKKYAPLKKSRYNSNVRGIICPLCDNNPVQETHHIIDQKQGQIKEVIINGIKKHINHKDNLMMICGSCHNKITRKEISIVRKRDVKKV